MEGLQSSADFPHVETILRIGLALGLGLFVGLEREWRHKEAGLRTFAFAGVLGALGGLLGSAYALLALGLIGVLVALMAFHAIRSGQRPELTTAAAMLVTGYVGVLSG